MKNTHIAVVLDRSGSMGPRKSDVIGGFNQFLEEQKKQEGEATLTLTQFDTIYEILTNGVNIQYVSELTNKTYMPRGATALLDAIGRTIEATKVAVPSVICGECGACKTDNETNIIFVIITDGEENSSCEFNLEQVKQLIQSCREKLGWEFIFLGADENAIQAGVSMGFNIGTCATYSSTAKGLVNTYGLVSSRVTEYRNSGKLADFTAEERSSIDED